MKYWLFTAFLGAVGLSALLCVGGVAAEDAPETVVVQVATNSENAGYEAYLALDGNPKTFWHSQFNAAPSARAAIPISCGYGAGCVSQHPKPGPSLGNNAQPPFELRVDLGAVRHLTGVVYWPRNDGTSFGCNGRIADYEIFAAETAPANAANAENSPFPAPSFAEDGVYDADWGAPIASGKLDESENTVNNGARIDFAKPIDARYLVFRGKNSLNGERFIAVAELEILSDGAKFVAAKPAEIGGRSEAARDARKVEMNEALNWIGKWNREAGGSADDAAREVEICKNSPYFADLLSQFNRIVEELDRPEYYAAIAEQLPTTEAGILTTDRDPLDVVFRRTRALWLDLNGLDASFFTPGDENFGANEKNAKFAGDFRFWTGVEKALETPVYDCEKRFQTYLSLAFLRRVLLFSRPELDFEQILFVKRNRSRYNHICDQFYGRSAEPGGGLFILENAFPKQEDAQEGASPFLAMYAPTTRNLLADSVVENDARLKGRKLEGGSFIAPELSFDGQKIAFAYCECEGDASHVPGLDLSQGHTQAGRCYHVFTCDVDGGNLTQITDGTWNDFDPCYLPNGRMAFISERRGGYLRCGRDCPTYTLFDMNQDGSKIRCLSYHETNEWAPSVANDGQILWTRWDYIDRFGCIAHHPWTTTPDGRNPRQIHGNYAHRHTRADAELDVRAIPDSANYIATAGPHHGQSFGSIIKIDPRAPDDPTSPVTRMTPDVGFPESQNGAQVWGTPWALAEDLFLAVADYNIANNEGREGSGYKRGDYGIYLADAFGNRELVYRDPEIGSSTPIPMVARETPPVIPSILPEDQIVDQPYVVPPAFDGERPQAVVSIQNVYDADLPLPPGVKIASIRVVQVFCMSVPSGRPPYEIGFREATATDSVKLARRVWGVAPVESDGSACFYVPADCEIYFQALDENGVAVHSMRSGTALRAGEKLSCVGCHEPRDATAANVEAAAVPLALQRAPSRLTDEGPGTQPVNFPELIQPILDEHCVNCHNEPESQAEGAPNLNREPKTRGFYASYANLLSGGFVCANFKSETRTIPGEFGARASLMYAMLSDHHDVELSDAERRRIALWLDTTANFYGVYEKEGCEKEYLGQRALPTLE
ncbi:MAG: hypothetical protein HUK22_05830 [Thermoguttaceae bacterium]|nr:hypothetical protein [Thermoguttaceae bacterium]